MRYWQNWKFFLPLIIFICLVCLSCVSTHSPEPTLTRYQYERPEMGIPFRLVFFAVDKVNADAAAEAAFARVKQLNDIMSDYDPESELSKLSQSSGHGKEVKVSDDLWRVLKRAQELAERSHGAFDITVGPCVILWRKARREQQMPDPARLEKARQAVGYQHVKLNPARHAVELLVSGMRLDLGGIAKGYAVDEALRVLRGSNVNRALVEGGGDVGVWDPPPGKSGWRVELAPLDASNAPPARFLLLKRAAISTSGDLYQRVEIDGKRYSHIVDPHTGIGLTDHRLVHVIAPNSITSDSLTKVVSVLNPDEALKFIDATPGVAAEIARKPEEHIETYESTRFKHFYDRN
jgi:thiamine biosynthesis lipoprotein